MPGVANSVSQITIANPVILVEVLDTFTPINTLITYIKIGFQLTKDKSSDCNSKTSISKD